MILGRLNMKNIEELLKTKNSEFEMMTPEEKKAYFNKLRNYCYSLKKIKPKISMGQRLIERYNPKIRKFDYEFDGIENIPDDGAILVINHSNSHDIINVYEFLTSFGLDSSVLLTSEGLNPAVLNLFKSANATIIDRFDKTKSMNGVYQLSNKVLNQCIGVIFSEGTWNLHPIKPMQNIRIGAAKVSAITKKPIIPTIMEYIEIPTLCDKESKLYKKCIIHFGKPILIDEENSLITQTLQIQKRMEDMRREIWILNDIKRDKMEDINPILYINHTWLKEYDGLANGFDANTENRAIYSKDGILPENEYYINEYGEFVPGTIPKKSLIRKY